MAFPSASSALATAPAYCDLQKPPGGVKGREALGRAIPSGKLSRPSRLLCVLRQHVKAERRRRIPILLKLVGEGTSAERENEECLAVGQGDEGDPWTSTASSRLPL